MKQKSSLVSSYNGKFYPFIPFYWKIIPISHKKEHYNGKKRMFFQIQKLQPLSHSTAQNPRLVQVFLNSNLCLLHFANNYKKEIGTLSLTFLRPPKPTLCQRSCVFGFCQRSNSTLLFYQIFILIFLFNRKSNKLFPNARKPKTPPSYVT